MSAFRNLLAEFERVSTSSTEKGTRFEVLTKSFFETASTYSGQFRKVWLWDEWPGRNGETDHGIDLVAEEAGSGDVVAIQCKFYGENTTLDYKRLSTFLAATGREPFRRGLVVSTKEKWTAKAEESLQGRQVPINRIGPEDFENSGIDWTAYLPTDPYKLTLRETKVLRPHQQRALKDVRLGFESCDRGKLVMACGTGKTLTSLRIAEDLVGAGGSVLFLVPSISLLSQSSKEWSTDADVPIRSLAVCSDGRAGKRGSNEDAQPYDLAFPASTDVDRLLKRMTITDGSNAMTVVFSTYQSIGVISEAQSKGLGEFDLIVCDEAHRTTGVTLADGDESAFVRAHDNAHVDAAKRLYMTATPRIFNDQTKVKATDNDAYITSMDDEATFGPEFHRLGFGDAVSKGLLTDYKVVVLAVDQAAVSTHFQRLLSDTSNQLKLDDVARLVGCWHALGKNGPQFNDAGGHMERAVAFSATIDGSKKFTEYFRDLVNTELAAGESENLLRVETDHVDGKTNVLERSNKLAWLRDEPENDNTCRVLSNAKCLTEGVDVPTLDAVMFLHPRKSLVDVVQAVGRVMRLAEGKDLGYVILPIGIPTGVDADRALNSDKSYAVVWEVLQALRSHDERLNAEINKINLNGTSEKIQVLGVGEDILGSGEDKTSEAIELPFADLKHWQDSLYARIVKKVGTRHYWQAWAADIQEIASKYSVRIRTLLEDESLDVSTTFDEFLTGLRNNLNDSITQDDAIAMLSQHLITRPVFEALFAEFDFIKSNPVSQVMQNMIETLDQYGVFKEGSTLTDFYDQVCKRADGIDTAEGKQKIIVELYETFFSKAFPKQAASLGIVYTPIEIVNFIHRSIDQALRRHFDGTTISDEGVHVLDPFTGTGTFIVQLLQSGLIRREDLLRKYTQELHANEIMLLAYYIAAINIESAFHTEARKEDKYEPFNGIVLTDTFQLAEDGDPMDKVFFPQNNQRADRQKDLNIRVICGNPPYSVGQTSQNDGNANLAYPTLDRSIAESYAAKSEVTNKNSLYDSYIRAMRWATDRIKASEDGGIVGFVINGGWLDSNVGQGIRRAMVDDFDHIYVFNLRGNQRTSGELSRREGGKVFGSGSRSTIAIVLLVRTSTKTPSNQTTVQYSDIGDYLSQEQKLNIVSSNDLSMIDWQTIHPDEHGDWINQRNPVYETLMPLAEGKDAIFHTQSSGLKTNRDAWVYNSSKTKLIKNVSSMIDFYKKQLEAFNEAHPSKPAETKKQRAVKAKTFVDKNPARISWDLPILNLLAGSESPKFQPENHLRLSIYRPFFQQQLAFDRSINNSPAQLPKLFPTPHATNLGINLVSRGSKSPFSVSMSDSIPCVHLIGSDVTNFLARWRFILSDQQTLGGEQTEKVSNLKPEATKRFRSQFGGDTTEDQIFYYVYGVLHSDDYRRAFEINLKKEAPRVPLVEDRSIFEAFSRAGKELADIHINYESVEPYPLVEEWTDGADPETQPEVLLRNHKKMKWAKTGKENDQSRLIYNPYLTLSGIPDEAHKYVLGTRSGLEWLIDRYYVKTDKASGIVNDVNQWGLERGEPRYIIDLIKRVVTVSVRTVEIVNSLPNLNFSTKPTNSSVEA